MFSFNEANLDSSRTFVKKRTRWIPKGKRIYIPRFHLSVEQCYECQTEMCLNFVDFEKGFDTYCGPVS